MTQPYKKQALRQAKGLTGPSERSSDANLAALVSKVLARPELYPDELKAWLPRFINTNVNLSLTANQLPAVQARQLIGGAGQPAFQNSWVNFGGGDESANYYKDPWERVYVGGVVKSGTLGATIFTLPAGYRPQEAMIYAVVSNGALGVCVIFNDGTVQANAGSNVYFSLSGISFLAFS
jgi:hypothetical protein